MAYYDDYLDYGAGEDPRFAGGGPMVTPSQPWWEQPRPSYVPADRQWPPPLPPGASYGPNPGDIIYPPGYQAAPNGRVADTAGTEYNPYDIPSPTGQTTTDPNAGGDPGGYGQGGGGGAPAGGAYGSSTEGFQFPQFTPPQYTPGAPFQGGQFKAPDPFSFGEFKAPTLEEAQNRPGYQFALEQGRKALENSAAARGVLRTGGTLKDLFSWGDKFGEQNYGNQFNQDLTSYTTNRENAADAYRLNYGISQDVFDRNYGSSKDVYDRANQQGLDTFDRLYRGASDAFNPTYNAATLKFSDLYNRDRDKLNALTQLAGYGA